MMKGWERRVRAPGLQEGGFAGDVGRVPSPGGGRQGHSENSWGVSRPPYRDSRSCYQRDAFPVRRTKAKRET